MGERTSLDGRYGDNLRKIMDVSLPDGTSKGRVLFVSGYAERKMFWTVVGSVPIQSRAGFFGAGGEDFGRYNWARRCV